jgi:GH25 family lysozyme M1 (1,4-beta-N-acetylmuramidase)
MALASTIDPLICDLYAGDLGGRPDILKLASAGAPWHGLIVKASEGNYYPGGEWFRCAWRQTRDLGSFRYSNDWFRGCYHYAIFALDGAAQADYYLRVVESAGGWASDLPPIVDVERAGQRTPPTKAQVEDCIGAFSSRIKTLLGRPTILYGGSLLRDLGITSHMGCSYLWIPRYAATLPASAYTDIGWTLSDTLLWQYCGDGEAYLAGYPSWSPMGRCDVSATIGGGGGQGALDKLRRLCFT